MEGDGGAVDGCWWASRRDSQWVGSAGRRGLVGGLGVPLTATDRFDDERAIDPRGGQLSQTTKPTNSQPNSRRHHIQSIESNNQHHIWQQVKVTAQEETRKLRENNSGIKEHGEDLSVAQTTVLWMPE